MNIGKLSLSLIAILALGSQAIAQKPLHKLSNDSERIGDFEGYILVNEAAAIPNFGANDCNDVITKNDLPINISKEYLERYDYTTTMKNMIFHLGINDPATVSDSTIEIIFPSFIVHDWKDSKGANIVIKQIGESGKSPDEGGDKIVARHSNSLGSNKETFDTETSMDIVDAANYCIAEDGGNSRCLPLQIELKQGNYPVGDKVEDDIVWNIYSNSGTAERRDHARFPISYKIDPQYDIICKTKYDGLVNWENDRLSFVVTEHSEEVAPNARPTSDIYHTNVDRLSYIIDNKFNACQLFDKHLQGNETTIIIDSAKSLNVAAWTGTLKSPRAGVTNGTFEFAPGSSTRMYFKTADEPIPSGETVYHARLVHDASGNDTIPSTVFTGDINLEVKNAALVRPAISIANGDKFPRNVGEWKDYVYIGQIPAAMSDNAVDTKIFIVNRSCNDATPKFRLIKDGVVTEVDGDEIKVDHQATVKLSELITKAGVDDGKYAVEVYIPGTAENFYVTAQVGTTGTDHRDLPVYNTSERD